MSSFYRNELRHPGRTYLAGRDRCPGVPYSLLCPPQVWPPEDGAYIWQDEGGTDPGGGTHDAQHSWFRSGG